MNVRERIGLLIIGGLAVLGARFLWLETTQMSWVVLHLGYWFFLALSALFLAHSVRERLWSRSGRWLRAQGPWVWALIIALTLLLCIHERFLFRINFDEHVLLGISRNMHYEHLAGWSTEGRLYWGTVTTIGHSVDKRPIFYPFVLSLIHNVTGYRPANAFGLNVGLTVIALLGCYRVGWLIGGRWRGALLACLLAGVPLLAQNATSGGFDLLNTTLIILLTAAVAQYLRSPSSGGLVTVGFLSMFLANTRYESIVYITVPCFCWVLGLLRTRGTEAGGAWRDWVKGRNLIAVPSALLLLPLAAVPALFSNGVFNSTEAFFQMTKDEYWNKSNFRPNLEHAVAFMLDPDRGGTNSVFLASAGILAMIVLPLALRRRFVERRELDANAQAWLIVGGIVLANVCMLLGLGWGSWDDPLVSRFTLPFWFLLSWTVALSLNYLLKKGPNGDGALFYRASVIVALMNVIFFAAPDASAARATNKLQPAFMLARSIEFLHEYDPWKRSLVVAGSSLPYLNYGYPSIGFHLARRAPQAVKYGLYENILVIFHYKRNGATGAWEGDLTMKPFEGSKFERLKTIQLDPFNRIVVARVLEMNYKDVPEWIPSTEDEKPELYGRRVYEMLP